jgi:hypothetical protein
MNTQRSLATASLALAIASSFGFAACASNSDAQSALDAGSQADAGIAWDGVAADTLSSPDRTDDGSPHDATQADARVSGACGPASGRAASAVPTTGLCAPGGGTPSSITGTGPYDAGPWAWSCVGANGGASAACSAPPALWTAATFNSHGVRGLNQPAVTPASMADMAATGANVVRVFAPVTLDAGTDSYAVDTTDVDNAVSYAKTLGYRVVIVFFPPENANDTVPPQPYWTDKSLQASLVSNWVTVATRYTGNPVVAGYDLVNEPIASEGGTTAGASQWISLATTMMTAIRTVDPDHVIIFEPSPGAIPEAFSLLTAQVMAPLLAFENVVYSVHDYEPYAISSQGVGGGTVSETYPSPATADIGLVDKKTLADQLNPVVQFAANFNLPIYVGEFSCVRWAPIAANGLPTANNYVTDQISLFEAQGWSWNYHAWQQYQGWDPELDESLFYQFPYDGGMPWDPPDSTAFVDFLNAAPTYRSESTDTMKLLESYYASNVH